MFYCYEVTHLSQSNAVDDALTGSFAPQCNAEMRPLMVQLWAPDVDRPQRFMGAYYCNCE